METKCQRCGLVFADNYQFVNKYNKRIYCNTCVNLLSQRDKMILKLEELKTKLIKSASNYQECLLKINKKIKELQR